MPTQWKPNRWIAIPIGVFLQSFAFLYLNRPKIFWCYFLVSTFVAILDWKLQTSFVFLFSLICPIHAYIEAKHSRQSHQRSWFSQWWGILTVFLLFITPVFLFRAFLYEPFSFPSASMKPTLQPGNHIVINKQGFGNYGTYGLKLLSKKIESPDLMQRGKLYAFYAPNKDVPYVQRLIALPGDTLAVQANQVFINGMSLPLTKVSETEKVIVYQERLYDVSYLVQDIKIRPDKNLNETTVPLEHYFFMGDNRDNSLDSRYWGYVASDHIIGEVVYIVK